MAVAENAKAAVMKIVTANAAVAVSGRKVLLVDAVSGMTPAMKKKIEAALAAEVKRMKAADEAGRRTRAGGKIKAEKMGSVKTSTLRTAGRRKEGA